MTALIAAVGGAPWLACAYPVVAQVAAFGGIRGEVLDPGTGPG